MYVPRLSLQGLTPLHSMTWCHGTKKMNWQGDNFEDFHLKSWNCFPLLFVVWWSWIKFYNLRLKTKIFFLPNRIFLISTWSRGLAATLWLRGTTHKDSRDGHDKDSTCLCNPLLVKSSIAKNSPPTWLHLPFLDKPSPAGHVHAAGKISLCGESSTTIM